MSTPILADVAGSISELKKNPMALVNSGNGEAVAVLNHNKPAFYCIPAKNYEELVEHLDDLHLAQIVHERKNEASVAVSLSDL